MKVQKSIKTQDISKLVIKRGANMKKGKKNISGLFIPTGLFFGLGVAFAIMKIWVVAGVFLGLGAGFLGMMLYLMKKEAK